MAAVLTVLVPGGVAFAHTDFDSSVPADGDSVDGPLTEVVVNFTNPAEPAGDGFELLDPGGTIRTPTTVDATDGTSFVLSFDPPLGTGTYAVRWSVRAGDAHPIDGSFQFEVVGAAPTTTIQPTVTNSVPTSVPTSTTIPTAGGAATPPTTAPETTSLDEFLSSDSSNGQMTMGAVGRSFSILGSIFGIGVVAALAWTVRGRRDELVSLLTWARLAGLVVAVGGLIEFASLSESDPGASFTGLVSTRAGVATALKVIGGLLVMFALHERAGRIVAPTRSVSAAVAIDAALTATDPVRPHPAEHRWTPSSTAAVGLLGYALVLASFWFDGHTVSEGPWALHALVNLVHLGAGAVWAGGVFAMTAIVWMRRRRAERTDLAAMVVRFSSIAMVSLIAVVAAGAVMTWFVLDAPGDLFGTDWGRMLVAKTAVVAVAAGLGGYNHVRLRPALEQRPDDPHLERELRLTLTAESVAFVSIAIVTAVLVASAT